MKSFLRLFVTGFYSGLSPKMPGTCGTFAALLLGLGLLPLGVHSPQEFFLLALITSGLGIFAINLLYARGFYLTEDPQEVVIDEWAGFFLALAIGVCAGELVVWGDLLAAFVLFRFFDILKPPPIRLLEQFPRGWGVMVDDLGAGVYAGAALLFLKTSM